MSSTSAGSPAVHGYHVHVYYDAETLPAATRLREELAARFSVQIGGLHDEPIGPHPVSSTRSSSRLLSSRLWFRG